VVVAQMQQSMLVVGHGDMAVLSGKDGNGDFALTVACLALQTHRGGRGEHGEAVG